MSTQVTAKTLEERLSGGKPPSYEQPLFLPNFGKPVENKSSPVPQTSSSATSVFRTLRRNPDDPAKGEISPTKDFSLRGFQDHVASFPPAKESLVPLSSFLWDPTGAKRNPDQAQFGPQGFEN